MPKCDSRLHQTCSGGLVVKCMVPIINGALRSSVVLEISYAPSSILGRSNVTDGYGLPFIFFSRAGTSCAAQYAHHGVVWGPALWHGAATVRPDWDHGRLGYKTGGSGPFGNPSRSGSCETPGGVGAPACARNRSHKVSLYEQKVTVDLADHRDHEKGKKRRGAAAAGGDSDETYRYFILTY